MYIFEKLDNNRVIKNKLDNYLIPPRPTPSKWLFVAHRSQTLH